MIGPVLMVIEAIGSMPHYCRGGRYSEALRLGMAQATDKNRSKARVALFGVKEI